MEWITKMNDAIDYIETSMEHKVDYEKAANVACCSLSRFQNIFVFITGITPSEYVRRRRMALSAKELLSSKIKILDLSFKYGYESPEAFTRSFKLFHGISPVVARKYGRYVDYPRISFQLIITGGHFTMEASAKFETYKDILIKMEIIELPETFKLAGVTSEGLPNFQNIGAYHDKYKQLMKDRQDPYTEVGLSSNVDLNSWYTFGCQVDTIENLPEGLIGFDMGLTKFACLTFRMQPGSSREDLLGGEEGGGKGMQLAGEYLANEWIPKNLDKLKGYFIGEHGYSFNIIKAETSYHTANLPSVRMEDSYNIYGCMEVYKTDAETELEMCFYLPLK